MNATLRDYEYFTHMDKEPTLHDAVTGSTHKRFDPGTQVRIIGITKPQPSARVRHYKQFAIVAVHNWFHWIALSDLTLRDDLPQ